MDRVFTWIASECARIMGQPQAFIISTLLIIVWGLSGPPLHYSDTWQLIVNTATTVLTLSRGFPHPEQPEPGRRRHAGEA